VKISHIWRRFGQQFILSILTYDVGLYTSDHRLNPSSNPVLTATPRSCGKGQISTPLYEIKTPERIGMTFGTVDYVHEICLKLNLQSDQRGFWGIYEI